MSTPVTLDVLPNRAIAQVTLRRPAKFNSLNLDMILPLQSWFADWARDDSTRPACVILRGEGKAFCAGGDVVTARSSALSRGRAHADFFFEEYRLNALIGNLRDAGLLQISLWDGVTMGGGVGLSLHGAFRVATPRTRFAMPETNIGFVPDVGASFALPRIQRGAHVGLYISLSGAHLGPADCLWTGLATHAIRSEDISQLCARLEEAGRREGLTRETVEELMRELAWGIDEMPRLKRHEDVLKRCFTMEMRSVEEIFAELRATVESAAEDDAAFAKETLEMLKARSPSSLKITFEVFHRHSQPEVTLLDALVGEYRIVQRLLEDTDSDFFEGVRAVLVDKDNKPQWRHPPISAETIKAYLEPLPKSHLTGDLTPMPLHSSIHKSKF